MEKTNQINTDELNNIFHTRLWSRQLWSKM